MVIVVAALLLVLIIPNGSNAQSVVLTTSACTPLGGTWTVQADITYTIGQTITQVDFVNSNGFTLRADTVYGSRSAFNIQSGSAATGRWVAVFTLSNVAATDNVGTVMVRITTTPGSTFRINTPTISGPTIAPPTEVYTVGFNTMEVNNGSTQLRCSVSCNTGSSSFTWYRNSVAVGTTSGSTSGLNTPFDAVDSGLYTCEPTGSSAKAPALWVGTPVYQCPFDRFAWCPSGAITRFMDRVPRPIIPTTMTAFGIVLVCGDVTSTASKAVSTRGSCPALTVCSDDIGIGPYTCSNNSPILYGTCNEKFSYYCPSMYVFSASTITGGGPQLVTGETRRIMVYDTSYTTAFKLWCGTEYSIIAPCHPDIGGSYTPHPTSFDIVRVGPNWTTGGITNAETISVAVGDYFRIDCPAAVVAGIYRNGVQQAIIFGGSPKFIAKSTELNDFIGNWECVSYANTQASTGTRSRLVTLLRLTTTVPPTTTITTTTTPPTTTTTTTTTPATTTTTTTPATTTTTTTTTTTPATTTTTTTASTTSPSTAIVTNATVTTTTPTTTTRAATNATVAATNATLPTVAATNATLPTAATNATQTTAAAPNATQTTVAATNATLPTVVSTQTMVTATQSTTVITTTKDNNSTVISTTNPYVIGLFVGLLGFEFVVIGSVAAVCIGLKLVMYQRYPY
uniref:Truncated membrane protein ORF25B n=3 Tax=Cyprinid herpesvirus 2 TaxID=317878 RepID=A0A6H0QXI5_CYHV2